MAFPTGTYTGVSGDLDVYIQEVWGSKINDFAKESLNITKFFTNRSDELVDGGDTIYTPNLTEMSANSKSSATAVTLNSPTETAASVVVSNWYEVSFAIEDKEAALVKRSYNIQEKLAKNAGYTAAKVLESAVIALFASFTPSVGASDSVVVDSDIRKALGLIEYYTKSAADSGENAFIFDTRVWWNQIAGISTFQLKINATADPVTQRPRQTLYGVPVYLSNLIEYVTGSTGRINVLANKDAIHYATASLGGRGNTYDLVRVQSNYVPEYLSTVTTADILYGVGLNRATYGVKILSSASDS